MKKSILYISLIFFTLLSQAASADNRHGRGWDRHHGYGFSNSYRHAPRAYWYPGYRDSFFNISLGSHHRHHDHFSGGSFIGGLVVGSVLAAPRYPDNYYRAPAVRQSSVTVIRRTPLGSGTSGTGRRLLRDLEGRCFEVNRDSSGNETRVELDPSQCNF